MIGVVCAVSLLGVDWSRFGRPGIDFVDREILVGVRRDARLAKDVLLSSFGRVEALEDGVFRIRIREGLPMASAYAGLLRNPLIEFAEPNFIAEAAFVPNDPAFSSQYGIRQTRTDLAWDLERGSEQILVAIVDTGIDKNHPEFEGRVVAGYDFVNSDSDPRDDHGHGTMCAGIVAAEANNAKGIAGVSFESQILPVKVLKSNGTGSYANIAKGIRYAADRGADVISLSLAGSSSSSALDSAVRYAMSKGAVLVAAAGNDGKKNKKKYPAAIAGVLSVGANDRRNNRLSISNYGSWVDVTAPGDAIYSTYPNNGYRTTKGTSMAAAFVAGQAALLKAWMGEATPPAAVRDRIKRSAMPVTGGWVASGMVDVNRSLRGDLP